MAWRLRSCVRRSDTWRSGSSIWGPTNITRCADTQRYGRQLRQPESRVELDSNGWSAGRLQRVQTGRRREPSRQARPRRGIERHCAIHAAAELHIQRGFDRVRANPGQPDRRPCTWQAGYGIAIPGAAATCGGQASCPTDVLDCDFNTCAGICPSGPPAISTVRFQADVQTAFEPTTDYLKTITSDVYVDLNSADDLDVDFPNRDDPTPRTDQVTLKPERPSNPSVSVPPDSPQLPDYPGLDELTPNSVRSIRRCRALTRPLGSSPSGARTRTDAAKGHSPSPQPVVSHVACSAAAPTRCRVARTRSSTFRSQTTPQRP
jgi:hypothetical protein